MIYRSPEGGLYRVPLSGGSAEPFGLWVNEFLLSPDGQWLVVWTQDAMLVSAPVAGGAVAQLGGGLAQSDQYAVSPDSRSVVYIAGDDATSRLVRVPIAGGEPVVLSPLPGDAMGVGSFAITPDSAYAVFTIEEPLRARGFSIASTPLDGGQPIMLWDEQQNGPASDWLSLSPDGQNVLFSADAANGIRQHFAVPVRGGPATAIGDPLAEPGRIVGAAVLGDQVLYAAQQSDDQSDELYRAPLSGGAALRLSGPRPFAGKLFFQVAPRSGQVVFAADLVTPGEVGLYSVPVAGGAATLLSAQIPPGASVEQFILSADQSLAVFAIYAGTRSGFAAIYAARLDGSQLWQVLGGGAIVEFRLLPDGRLLYQADADRDGITELFVTPLANQ
ncbi:MAG: hypothetical protein HC822_27210 [Oscillochloris sp.]|nr:hypothetical protein [Oscillochloris sp.]